MVVSSTVSNVWAVSGCADRPSASLCSVCDLPCCGVDVVSPSDPVPAPFRQSAAHDTSESISV